MLKRISMTLSWQRLIGIASGIFGAALTVATAAQLLAASSFRALGRPTQFLPAICGCVFLFLAFPLFTGREWARRALLFTTYCTLAVLATSFSLMVFQRSLSPSTSCPGLWFVTGACALVGVLTPPAFLLAVLHHADVRRAFQLKSASNQPLQPTAGRSDD